MKGRHKPKYCVLMVKKEAIFRGESGTIAKYHPQA